MINILKKKKHIRKEINNLNFLLNKTEDENIKNFFYIVCSYLNNPSFYSTKNRIIDKIDKLEYLYKYLNSLCQHEFIEDYIDIDPDLSQKIVYCQKCEYTLL